MELKAGDWVQIKRKMHATKQVGGRPVAMKYDMFREGEIIRFKGEQSAIIRVNLRPLENGEWYREEMLCRIDSLTKIEKQTA